MVQLIHNRKLVFFFIHEHSNIPELMPSKLWIQNILNERKIHCDTKLKNYLHPANEFMLT